jgi:hypothetical protein
MICYIAAAASGRAEAAGTLSMSKTQRKAAREMYGGVTGNPSAGQVDALQAAAGTLKGTLPNPFAPR